MDLVGVSERKTQNAAPFLSGTLKTVSEYINNSQSSIQDKGSQFNSYSVKTI